MPSAKSWLRSDPVNDLGVICLTAEARAGNTNRKGDVAPLQTREDPIADQVITRCPKSHKRALSELIPIEDPNQEALMCRSLVIVFSAVLVIAVIGSLSPAVAARYCLQGRHFGYPGNCGFSTYHQCRAAAAGTSSYCGVNPHYAFARRRPAHH